MAPLPLLNTRVLPNPEPSPLSAEWLALLNHMRMIALNCRAAARADLFEACALLSAEQEVARDAHAHALMKGLNQALTRRAKFFRPGTAEMSFDEAWLMRAVTAAKWGDADSLAFLIRSRVPQIHRRNIAYLVASISDQFDLV